MKRDDDVNETTSDGKPEEKGIGIILLAVMGGLVILLIGIQMC